VKTLVAIGVAGVLVASCTPNSTPAAAVSPGATPTTLANGPLIDQASALSWDGVDGRVMVISPVQDPVNKTMALKGWTFAGSSWHPAPVPPIPSSNGYPVSLFLAYDSSRRREIFVGGYGGDVQTWEWDGRFWQKVATAHSAQGFRSGAYSPELHALVGWDGFADGHQTWVYDGTDWRSIRTTASPFTSFATIDYDPVRHSIVALSGPDYSTWLWTGQDWTALPAPSNAPVAGGGAGRQQPNIGFNRHAGRWLVQGGAGFESDIMSDTSTGDASGWREEPVSKSPGPRLGAKLTWDPQRNAVLLFGGTKSGGCCQPADLYDDGWAWDGTTWSQLAGAVLAPTPAACKPASSYGVVTAGGNLELVDTCGKVAATTPIAPSSVQLCSTGGVQAALAPPVSTTNNTIYYRDGDTKIQSLSADGRTADVTTVPGGPSTVSFFSVSPDDQRIAVVVEDLSPAGSIGLRLYVEDLRGGGHHADIYTTSLLKSGGTTLWPMGWHGNSLMLAVMTACSSDVAGLSPVSWHVVDASTAGRQASIDMSSCGTLSLWPSPAGVVCGQYNGAGIYQWSGKELVGLNTFPCVGAHSSLSPSGDRYFYSSTTTGCSPVASPSGPFTWIQSTSYARSGGVPWHAACLWIDNDHLLTPDSVITVTSGPSPTFTRLPGTGSCVGRFPGGL
jgi:hypothetical protein